MKSGKVTYAYLVQANEILFKKTPPRNAPANVIFGMDEYYDSHPEELARLASELFRYKNKSNVPPELRQLTDAITGEMERLFNIPLPLSMTGGKTVYFTTIMVQRNHLPEKRIISSLFPLVCDPDNFKTSIILPKAYWPNNFIRAYIKGIAKDLVEQETWSENDEKYFFERYAQMVDPQPQYLLNKAISLYNSNERSPYDKILRILERYFYDFPDDKDNKVSALLLVGEIYYTQKRFDKSFNCYKEAAEFEIEYPEVNCGAWLSYAEFIVKFEKAELFDEAEKYINMNYDKLNYPEAMYILNAVLALISGRKGDLEKQRYYRERADDILKGLTGYSKSVRYANTIQVRDVNHDLSARIVEFLQKKGFVIGKRRGSSVWLKKGPMCFHYITTYYLFDVVVTVAYISFKDIASGVEREMGLNGFIACIGKLPLKKIVRQLEKMLS